MREEIADKVDLLYQRFTTARIPIQTFSTDDRTAVAIVFERINRLGVELESALAAGLADQNTFEKDIKDLYRTTEPVLYVFQSSCHQGVDADPGARKPNLLFRLIWRHLK